MGPGTGLGPYRILGKQGQVVIVMLMVRVIRVTRLGRMAVTGVVSVIVGFVLVGHMIVRHGRRQPKEPVMVGVVIRRQGLVEAHADLHQRGAGDGEDQDEYDKRANMHVREHTRPKGEYSVDCPGYRKPALRA